jgi:hypothetical protein
LDELPEPGEDQYGLGILQIIACPQGQTIAKAKTWLARVQKTSCEESVFARTPGGGRCGCQGCPRVDCVAGRTDSVRTLAWGRIFR